MRFGSSCSQILSLLPLLFLPVAAAVGTSATSATAATTATDMVVLGTGAAVAAGSVYKTVYDVFGHLLPRLGIKRLFLGTLYKDSFGGKFPTYFTWLTRRLVDVFTPPEWRALWRADVDMELVRYLSLPGFRPGSPKSLFL